MPRAGTLTNRLVDCDITIMDIGGVNILAVFTDFSITITQEEIDVSSPQDTWKQREQCVKDWNISATKLMLTSGDFAALIIAGGAVTVCTNLGGDTFYGTGIISSVGINSGSPQNETIEIMSGGGSPTLTSV